MKVKRQYIEILQFLSGKNVYDSTLGVCIDSYKITDLGIVVGVKNGKEYDLLPIFPAVKTANKMIEMILKNATLAISGVWQYDDDGVMDYKKVAFIPGAIMPKAVGSAGLKPLSTGRKFNITWEMIISLQQQIKNYFATALEQKDKS